MPVSREPPYHALRHSFISILLSQGKSWDQIAAFVGHLDRRATKLYTHFNTAESKKRMESLEIRFMLMGNVGCRKTKEEHHGY